MEQHFLPTGRVRHYPCSEHAIGPDGRHFITSRLGDIVHVADRPERYVVIGTGKTALDTCVWLLLQGVPAARGLVVEPALQTTG
jgi:hypothetical protein